MNLTLDPDISESPAAETLLAKGATLAIGGVRTFLRSQRAPVYLHRVSADEMRLRTTKERPPGVILPARLQRPDVEKLRALWGEIHRMAWDLDPDQWRPFIAALPGRLPCGECRLELLAWLAKNGWDYSSVAACFFSSWALHDSVSARIGRPRISFDEALLLWQPEKQRQSGRLPSPARSSYPARPAVQRPLANGGMPAPPQRRSASTGEADGSRKAACGQ